MMETILGLVTYYETFLVEYFNVSNLAGAKIKITWKVLLVTIIIAGVNYGLTILGIINLKMMISFFSVFIICKMLAEPNAKRSFIISVVYYLIIVAVEYGFSILLIRILKYNPQKYIVSVGIQKSIIGNIVNVVLFFTCLIPLFRKVIYKTINVLDKAGIEATHLYIFILSIFLLQFIYIINVVGKMGTVLSIVYVLIFIIFIIYIATSIYRNYYLKELNRFLIKKDDEMQEILDDYRLFRHNIKHDLLSIYSVSNKKVKEMINCIIEDYKIDKTMLTSISKTPSGIQGVIYQKIINSNSQNKNIIIDNYIANDPVMNLKVKDYYKFIESVGILIDNALEYSNDGDNDFIYMYFGEDEKKYEFRITNPILTDINIDSIFEKGNTTKDGHMGVGLYYIKKKTNFDINIVIDNSLFTVTLKINK